MDESTREMVGAMLPAIELGEEAGRFYQSLRQLALSGKTAGFAQDTGDAVYDVRYAYSAYV